MIVSIATVVLPVWRSPMMSWRWPRPIGVIASIDLMPVCSGSCTDLRWTTVGRLQLEGTTLLRLDLAETVDRVAERVDDAAEEVVADRDREDLARALDGLALLDAGEVTEDDDTDLVDVEVQREAERAVLELQQLVGHGRGQTLDVSNAVTGVGDAADLFAGGRAGLVGLDERVQRVPDLLRTDRKLRHVRSSPRFRPALSESGGVSTKLVCVSFGTLWDVRRPWRGVRASSLRMIGSVDDLVTDLDLDAAQDPRVDEGVDVDPAAVDRRKSRSQTLAVVSP